MAFLKLMLIVLPALAIADARSLDAETVQEHLMDADGLTDELSCQDCKQTIEILKHLLSDQTFQAKMKTTLESLCDSLPDTFTPSCLQGVKTNLPVAPALLTDLMSPDHVCSYLGLCESDLKVQMEEMLMNHIQNIFTPSNIEISSCGICKFVLNLIPRGWIQRALCTVSRRVCSLLPNRIRGLCSHITQKLVRMTFKGLLNPGSPRSLCNRLRLCQRLTTANAKAGSSLSDCDRCLTLAVLARLSLGSNATQPHVSSFLGSVCQMHPEALPECKSFTEHYGRQLQGFLGNQLATLDVCQSADLCVRSEKADQGDVGHPWTLGPSYTCKNMQTA